QKPKSCKVFIHHLPVCVLISDPKLPEILPTHPWGNWKIAALGGGRMSIATRSCRENLSGETFPSQQTCPVQKRRHSLPRGVRHGTQDAPLSGVLDAGHGRSKS